MSRGRLFTADGIAGEGLTGGVRPIIYGSSKAKRRPTHCGAGRLFQSGFDGWGGYWPVQSEITPDGSGLRMMALFWSVSYLLK